MKVLALLIAAALPLAAHAEVEALKLDPQNKMFCNEQKDWCVGIDKDGPFADSRTLRSTRHIWDEPDIPDFAKFKVWPQIIRTSEDRAIVGVIGQAHEMFSGGGFTRHDLYLFDVTLGEPSSSNQIFSKPVASDISIRACFNEQDSKKRAGQCEDVYTFAAEVKPLSGDQDYPDLQYTSKATRQPVGASRFEDSTTKPALNKEQAGVQTDKQCSYTVTYKWKKDGAIYEAATPVPDCDEFLEARPHKK